MNIILLVLLAYIILLFAIAWYFSRGEDLESYFLNKRQSNIWIMTLANFSTIIGAGATVAVIAEVYNTGVSFGIAMPVSFMAGAVVMGFVANKINAIGRKYDASNLADFFGSRYDKKNETLVAFLQIILAVVWIGIQAVAFGSLVSVLTNISFNTAVSIATLITIIYTAVGGLKIDLISDFIQFWIIFIVFLIMAVLAWGNLAWSGVIEQVPSGHLDLFSYGGITWFLGIILVSGFIYIGNTAHWQRIMSAQNPEVARKSYYYLIPLMAVFSFVMIYLGLFSVVTIEGMKPDMVIFSLMENLLPGVLAGVGFAAILSVIMSSIDSLLVGGSTIIYKRFLEDKLGENVTHARLVTALFGILGFLLAFLIPDVVALSLLLAYFAIIFAPPCFAALYSEKITGDATFWAILLGTITLFITFPTIGKNSFVFSTLASLLITLFYDNFKK